MRQKGGGAVSRRGWNVLTLGWTTLLVLGGVGFYFLLSSDCGSSTNAANCYGLSGGFAFWGAFLLWVAGLFLFWVIRRSSRA
jgi:hypothetical protein